MKHTHTYLQDSLVDRVLQDTEANLLIKQIRSRIKQFPISDVLDQQKNQYVDLVLEGGGVLGIALLGYLYALEQAGIRFLHIAGTSAGAITATLLAAVDSPEQAKTIRLMRILDAMPMQDFMDGGKDVQQLMYKIRTQPERIVDKLWPLMKLAVNKLSRKKLGLNPGIAFEEWLRQTLIKEFKVHNLSTLEQRFLHKNPLIVAKSRHPQSNYVQFSKRFVKNQLAIIAADISTESKIQFPLHAHLYWPTKYQSISPAKFVRASMAIPFFFEPVICPIEDTESAEAKEEWQKQLKYTGNIPEKAYLVDGGIVSNFPIDVFHQTKAVPLCPTFGVKLNTDRQVAKQIAHLGKYAAAIFDTARHLSDYTFLAKHPDYKHLVTYIDLSEKVVQNNKHNTETERFHWLDFNMDSETKFALFMQGMKAAKAFICDISHMTESQFSGFDWESYKTLRAQQLQHLKHGFIESLVAAKESTQKELVV